MAINLAMPLCLRGAIFSLYMCKLSSSIRYSDDSEFRGLQGLDKLTEPSLANLSATLRSVGHSPPTRTSRIAYVLRGESFRTPQSKEFHDHTQFGPLHRHTCGDGAKARQKKYAFNHLQGITYLESLGFEVTLFGVTYECTGGDADYKIEEAIPKMYEGRMRKLRMLDKAGSTQVTGIRTGVNMVLEDGGTYDHVIIGRWDNTPWYRRWACHLRKGFQTLQDLYTLEGIGNDDVLIVVPHKDVKHFAEFVDEKTEASIDPKGKGRKTCCEAQCGTGDCHPCVQNYIQWKYNTIRKKIRWEVESCPDASHSLLDLGSEELYEDPFAWLPSETRKCMEERRRKDPTYAEVIDERKSGALSPKKVR